MIPPIFKLKLPHNHTAAKKVTLAPPAENGYDQIIIDLSYLNNRIQYLEKENARLENIIEKHNHD